MLLLLNVMVAATASAQPKTGGEHYAVRLTVSEKGSGESIMMASCYLQPLGAYTVTNIDGKENIRWKSATWGSRNTKLRWK